MKILLSTVCFSFLFTLHAQINPGDQAKIAALVGKDVTILKNQKRYPYSSLNKQCEIQPSLTRKYDTTGIYFNNEYVLFHHPIGFRGDAEILKLMKQNYVSVGEYVEFQNYVRDSIARDKILMYIVNMYEGQHHHAGIYDEMPKENKEAEKMVRHADTSIMAPYDYHRNFALNWDYKFSYSDKKIIPVLVDLYLPQPERLNKVRIFDERKLAYAYSDRYKQFEMMSQAEMEAIFPVLAINHDDGRTIRHVVPTLSDTYYWSANSAFDRDEFSILGQLYNQKALNEPVVGITGMQANAFCNWKQQMIQQEMNRKGLKYTVIVTPPLFEDLPQETALQMVIPERDYTSQWRITTEEYQKFIACTKDSILLEKLYEAAQPYALEILRYTDPYFDEGSLEFEHPHTPQISAPGRFDEMNRYYFPLNFKYKIPESLSVVAENIRKSTEYQNPRFGYSYMDAQKRSIVGELRTKTVGEHFWQERRNIDTMTLQLFEIDTDGEYIGKDLSMDYYNDLDQSYGVRSYENFQRLIHSKSVAVLLETSSENADPKSLLKTISYEQAIAFYYWKYPLHKIKPGDTWQQFVLPSEEQFHKVQNGENVIVPARKADYPTPVFRYVVHIYPAEITRISPKEVR